jgi:hypothetical protein
MIENVAGIIVLFGLGAFAVFLVIAIIIYMSVEK